MTSLGRVLIVANPMAGTISNDQVWQLVTRCKKTHDVSVRWTTAPGDAFTIAQSAVDSPLYTVLIAVGGDGTAREVAAGLATAWNGLAPVAMMIVPAGTANSNYHTLWGELSWQDAVDEALAKPSTRLRHLDLARVSELDRLVLSGACSGFPPQAIHESRAITDWTGPARYHKALVNLAHRYVPYPGRVVVDGVEVHSGPTLFANVGGSRYRGGYFELLPHSVTDDGLLDVCVVGGEYSAGDVMRLSRKGAHVSRPGVVYARGRQIRIERTDGASMWFEHDGEVLVNPRSSVTLDVVPGAVPMLVGEGPAVS